MQQVQRQNKSREPQIPFSEKLRGIPGFFGIRLYDEPHYEVLVSDGHREIRRYSPVTLATLTAPGDYEEASENAFLRLADYIFSPPKLADADDSVAPIPMTAPVFQQKSRAGWTLSFILPEHLSLASAPRPKDPGITLQQVPSRLMASLRYSGVNDEQKMEEQSRELLAWIEKNGTYRPTGEVICAQYDGPHTIPFLRRNEIQIPVLVKH